MEAESALQDRLAAILAADCLRLHLLAVLRDAWPRDALPWEAWPQEAWIGAGAVRNAVWDHLHGRPVSPPAGDIDVVWFDPDRATAEADRRIEDALRAAFPAADWSVRNQARMHGRNGDPPYRSTRDAISHWPETATAIAARLAPDRPAGDRVEILAPHGLGDLFGLILRPTPAFRGRKLPLFRERVRDKGWLERWPRLTLAID